MKKIDWLKTGYWIAFAMAVGAFYIGLRSEAYKVEYTVISLILWGISYWINKMIAREKIKD